MLRTRPMTPCQRSTSHLEVKGKKYSYFISYCFILWNFVEMFNMLCRRVTYKTHDSMSKVKVTLRVKRSKMCNLCLVRAITSKVIVVSSWNFVEMFTMFCRCVAHKTHDSMSKVKVTIKKSKMFNLCLVQAITS